VLCVAPLPLVAAAAPDRLFRAHSQNVLPALGNRQTLGQRRLGNKPRPGGVTPLPGRRPVKGADRPPPSPDPATPRPHFLTPAQFAARIRVATSHSDAVSGRACAGGGLTIEHRVSAPVTCYSVHLPRPRKWARAGCHTCESVASSVGAYARFVQYSSRPVFPGGPAITTSAGLNTAGKHTRAAKRRHAQGIRVPAVRCVHRRHHSRSRPVGRRTIGAASRSPRRRSATAGPIFAEARASDVNHDQRASRSKFVPGPQDRWALSILALLHRRSATVGRLPSGSIEPMRPVA